MVQTYAPILYEGKSSRSRPFEFGSQYIDDSSEDDQVLSEIDVLEESNIIDLDLSIEAHDKIFIMTLITFDFDQPDNSSPLLHPDFIDWEQKETLDIPIFLDDDAIVNYLCAVEPKTSSTSELKY